MKEQRITGSERAERVLARLYDRAYEKAMAIRVAREPILDEAEFFEDMRELPSEFVQEIEERAQMLEEAVQTGKLGRGHRKSNASTSNEER